MSTQREQINIQEAIGEASLNQQAEINEHLKAAHDLSSATLDELEKVKQAIKDIKIPEPPTNEETHKLLSSLIEEFKKPCHITLKLK